MADEKNFVNDESIDTTDAVVESTSSEKEVKAVSPKKKSTAPKKANPFVRFGRWFKKFCVDFNSERKKIVWLSRKDTVKSTILVVTTVVIIGAVLGLVDFALQRGILALGTLV